jgi:hypothetical protein
VDAVIEQKWPRAGVQHRSRDKPVAYLVSQPSQMSRVFPGWRSRGFDLNRQDPVRSEFG